MTIPDQDNQDFVTVYSPKEIPGDTDPDDRIVAIFQMAWAYYRDLAEHPVEQVSLRIAHENTLNAKVFRDPSDGHVVMEVDIGCLHRLDTLWRQVMETSPPKSGLESHDAPCAFEWANLSMFWLILHEIGHLHFDHLALIKDGKLQENYEYDDVFGLIPSVAKTAEQSAYLDHKVFQCLELQADSVATECFLGVYSADMTGEDLIDLRFTATAAVAVMLIIHHDHENRGILRAHSRHPSPAARIFILLGIIAQHAFRFLKKSYDNGEKQYLAAPTQEDHDEMDAYRDIVFAPLLAHLESVCRVLGGPEYFSQIGLGRNLISDIPKWMLATDLPDNDFDSDAARECAALYSINLDLLQASTSENERQ